MELERDVLVSPTTEVPVVEGEVVLAIRALADCGVGSKAIARAVGVARNTVRRYLRQSIEVEGQVRPAARRLTDDRRLEARTLYEGPAGGNAVVVQRLLAARGLTVSVRTIERAVADLRRERRVAQLATVRVETAPGDQLQIDFGQKRVPIAGTGVRVFLLVAVLSYSRRLFVKAFLSERQDDWREGIAGAFTHFGGVPRTLLGDNARALVVGRDRGTGTVVFHPTYLAFCRDWDVQPRACAPYRARTKGKTEAGVKFVKRNGLAGAGLRRHSPRSNRTWRAGWSLADQREHGTTHEAPMPPLRPRRARMRCGRSRRAPCPGASSASGGGWPTMPSWTSTRCATACRIGWCATTWTSSSRSRSSASSTGRRSSRRTRDRGSPCAA